MAQQQNILQIQKLELQELNRILKDIQQRLNDLQGFSGRVEVDAELEARGLVVTEIPQQEEVALSEEGKIWFQPREGQAPEAQLQVTESTLTDFGTIRRRLDVVQRAAQDGEDVGKASTFDFNSPLTALVDLDTDEVDVGVDPDALLDVIDWDAAAELIDHGLLDGLGDDDHPQYLKEKASGGTAAEVPEHTHASAAQAGTVDHGVLDGLGDALDHPMLQRKHGFELNSDGSSQVTISYDAPNRIVTVTPNGVDYKFWIDGVQFTKALGEQSIAHGTTTGLYFLFYNSSGVLTWSTSPWSIRDRTVTPVALVYWNNTLSDGICFYECHTADRVLEFHYNLHFSRGCQYISGYDLTGYTLATDTDAAVTYAIGTGVIADEDIRFASTAVPDGGPYVIFYRIGVSGEWRWTTSTFPFPVGTEMQYNQWTGATWQLTDVTPGGTIQYVNFYICATTVVTPQAAQAFIIPGQSVYTSLAAAQAESLQSLSLGTLPFEEVAPLYRVTLQSRNSYGGTHQVQITQITSIKNQTVTVAGGAVGITDHGALTGLGDDDHTDYVRLNTARAAAGVISLTDTGSFLPQIILSNGNADASSGYLIFQKLSASPANGDILGTLLFQGYNSTPALTSFGLIYTESQVVTAGAENGVMHFQVMSGGTLGTQLTLNPGSVTSIGSHFFSNDAAFYLGKLSSNPITHFDTSDYLLYNRTTNIFDWYIGGTSQMTLSATGLTTAGTVTTAGVVSPGNLSNWYLGTTSSQPLLNFDSGDYATYQRTNNELELYIGSAKALGFKSKTIPLLTESHGGTIYNSGGIPNAALNIIVWRAPYACTVTNVRGYRVGGTGATINARKNGSSNHLSSAVSLSSADTWTDGGAVQNTSYAAGDKLEIMVVTTTGTVTQLGIQVDFERA